MNDRHLVLAATSLGSSLAFLDATVVNVALPAMRRDLEMGLAGQQWIVLSYALALAACYLAAGAIADRIGLQRGFVLGTIAFAISSLIVGVAPDELAMIAARVVQGAAASLLTTTSLALLRVTWGDDSGRAIGLWTSLTSAAILAGPPIGGIVIDSVSWRWIFLANLPLAALTLLLVLRARTPDPDPDDLELPAPPDVWSLVFATSAVAIVAGVLIELRDLHAALATGLLALAAGFVVLLELRRRRGVEALIPIPLLRNRVFASASAATFFIYAALGGLGFFASLYLQSPAVGYTALEAGLVQIPTTLILLALAPTFGRMSDRHGPRWLLVIGPVLLAAGTLVLATVRTRTLRVGNDAPWLSISSIDGLLPGMVLCGLGLAIFVSPITTAVLHAAPDHQAGIASATSNLAARTGSLVAIAALGLVVAATFDAASSKPAQEPFDARNTGALEAADRRGWHASMIGCALLALTGATIAGVGLRAPR